MAHSSFFWRALAALAAAPLLLSAAPEPPSGADWAAAIAHSLDVRGYHLLTKAVDGARVVVESEPGTEQDGLPRVIAEWGLSAPVATRVVLSAREPGYAPQSVRAKLAARHLAPHGCTLFPEPARIVADCRRTAEGPVGLSDVESRLDGLLGAWQAVRAEQGARLHMIEARDVAGLLTAAAAGGGRFEARIAGLAEAAADAGLYVDEVFAGAKGGQLTVSTQADAGLFLTLYALPIKGGVLYTTVFDPALAFGGVDTGRQDQVEPAVKAKLSPRGCLKALSPGGFCNSYLNTDYHGKPPRFKFPVRAFQGVETLQTEIEALTPVYRDVLKRDQLRGIAERLRPAIAGETP